MKQIAGELDIATRTVEFHIDALKRRLGASGRHDLLRYAWDHWLAVNSKVRIPTTSKAVLRGFLTEVMRGLVVHARLSQDAACDLLHVEIEKLRTAALPQFEWSSDGPAGIEEEEPDGD